MEISWSVVKKEKGTKVHVVWFAGEGKEVVALAMNLKKVDFSMLEGGQFVHPWRLMRVCLHPWRCLRGGQFVHPWRLLRVSTLGDCLHPWRCLRVKMVCCRVFSLVGSHGHGKPPQVVGGLVDRDVAAGDEDVGIAAAGCGLCCCCRARARGLRWTTTMRCLFPGRQPRA